MVPNQTPPTHTHTHTHTQSFMRLQRQHSGLCVTQWVRLFSLTPRAHVTKARSDRMRERERFVCVTLETLGLCGRTKTHTRTNTIRAHTQCNHTCTHINTHIAMTRAHIITVFIHKTSTFLMVLRYHKSCMCGVENRKDKEIQRQEGKQKSCNELTSSNKKETVS